MQTSRRTFLQTAALATAGTRLAVAEPSSKPQPEIQEFSYRNITLAADSLPEQQFRRTQATLQTLDEDALLKPFRVRAGMPAPGPDLGGWYDYVEPNASTANVAGGVGFCPGSTFGQWLSAFARAYATDRDPATRAKLIRLLDQYGPTISETFYSDFRFPAYVYEKLNVGLLDAYRYAQLPQARELFVRTAAAAGPHLPPRPLDRDEQRAWRQSKGEHSTVDFCYDESYTLPENLFLATRAGIGDFRPLAKRYLLDRTWFDPLSRNENVLDGHHAYSYCNTLNSGMQAYFDSGETKYLNAALNGFRMITEQSYATGGWGPQEGFDHADGDRLYKSLTNTSDNFETPCGAYAHFKITSALLRVTGQASYGDSMERVFYNTVLGSLPLQPDGRSFYYSDFAANGHKRYHGDRWPCCSGTIGQVTADYRISTYFHDPRGVFVNLYIPSTLRFTAPNGAECNLTQTGAYPLGGTIRFRLEMRRNAAFALRLRIPAFSPNAVVKVNGQRIAASHSNGWAKVSRPWRNGDEVELTLDMSPRLEAIDIRHPNTVALLRGPLVLFALGKDVSPLSRQQLLAARSTAPGEWFIDRPAAAPLALRPFTAIRSETYQTYLNATASS